MNTRGLARLGLLAVGFGIGAAFASTGIASADDSSTDPFSLIGAINPGGPDIPAASSAPSDLNFAISINGKDFTHGTAVAESGKGDFAIASGNDSFACAGCSDSPGKGDFAFASGANSSADSGFGNFDDAIAKAGGTADAGLGNYDAAIANGNDAFANATGVPDVTSNFDFADAMGANTNAEAGGGITGPGLNPDAPSGNDVALVFDPSGTEGSTALAGDGKFDLAAVLFADGLTANATGADHLVDILPMMAGDAASGAATTGGGFLADLASLF